MKTQVANDVVRSRISHELKRDSEAVLNALGLSLSDGIRLFLKQVVTHQAIPFEIKTPNAATLAAMREAESRAARFSSGEDLIDELEKSAGQSNKPQTR